jgi:hypothetical protein
VSRCRTCARCVVPEAKSYGAIHIFCGALSVASLVCPGGRRYRWLVGVWTTLGARWSPATVRHRLPTRPAMRRRSV